MDEQPYARSEEGDEPAPGQVTRLLHGWRQGDTSAFDELSGLVFGDLRRLAGSFLRRERSGHTLQPTALINESFLRLLGGQPIDWQGRAHFFGIAARLMRQVLVDHARKHEAAKRGGGAVRVTLEERLQVGGQRDVELISLDRALSALETLDERQSRVVELRYFGGLDVRETAEALGISPATVKREWATAKAWLFRYLQSGEGAG